MIPTSLAPTVRTVFTPDGAVVMEINRGLMYSSNPVAGKMLELLQAGKTRDEISSVIAVECGVDKNSVALDLDEFLIVLRGFGIVEGEITL